MSLHRRPIVWEGLALAVLVAAQAALFGRLVGNRTDYDEGVYLTSLDALEHGQRLGEDVFAPQPPGWYLLLRLISLAGADTVRGFHIGMVVVAIATCFAAYLLGRAIAGPVAGLAASALLTIAPPFPLFAHQVLADVPAVHARAAGVLGRLGGTGAALRRARSGGGRRARAGDHGEAERRTRDPDRSCCCSSGSGPGRGRALVAALGGAVLVGLVFALAYRDVLGELWESVVVYHRDARDTPDVVDKWHELTTFLNWRTPFAWLVVAGLVASVLLLRRRQVGAVWALWAWAAVSAAFLAYHHPLHHNHLLALPVALAVPAAVALGTLALGSRHRPLAIGALAVVLAAGYVQQQRRVTLDIVDERPELVRAAELMQRETEPDDLVVSDQPIVPFLADRRVAGPLVDTAVLRFQTGSLTDAEVMAVLREYDVRAVVADRAFLGRPALLERLGSEYRLLDPDEPVRMYVAR